MTMIIGTVASSILKLNPAFDLIATQNSVAGTSSFTFSSIPSTYRHLHIRGTNRVNGMSFTVANLGLRFNGDTGTNYGSGWMVGNGTSVSANSQTLQTASYGLAFLNGNLDNNHVNGLYAPFFIDIFDYATAKTKTWKTIATNEVNTNSANYNVQIAGGVWNSTSTISSITFLTVFGETFASGTAYYLYGIKGA